MERKTYLGRYQAATDERGEPMVLDRGASSVTLRGQETTTGEPVVIEVVRPGPLQQVPLEQVEADARAAQKLEHLNIARLRDFGVEEGDIVYVREFLDGSTLDVWVREHGALPVAAVMRIALQGVNALSAAAFQNVTHRAIQPASLMIVPGQTPDGDWPLVKILNFGGIAPTFSRNGFTTTGAGELALFAAPEQLQGATPDFKSDIYALGATLWFLLTGVAPRVGMLDRARGIPKNVAAVISRMLASNPEQRPVDPLVLQEDIRACLGRAEMRESIGRRFGFGGKAAKPAAGPVVVAGAVAPASTAAIGTAAAAAPPPLAAMAPAEALPEELESESEAFAPPTAEDASPANVGRFLLRPLAWAAVLLTIGMIAAMTLPSAIRAMRDRQVQEGREEIGVKVGVPEPAANAVAAVPTAPSPAQTDTSAPAAAPEISQAQDTAVAANRTAPAAAASPSFPSAGTSEQSQPTVAAAPVTTKLPDENRTTSEPTADNIAAASQSSAPVVASTDNNSATGETAQTAPVTQTTRRTEPPARQQQVASAPATSTAPVVAANTAPAAAETTEPAAPAEGPDDSAATAQNNTRQTRTVAKREAQTEPTAAQPAAGKAASASAEGERRPVRTASTSKTRLKAGSRSGLTAEEQTELEVRQALPITPEDEAALPPVPRGSKRARYLGTTPDGALVFGVPQSSERLYAAPPPAPERSSRRSRRAAPQDVPVMRAEPVDPAELEEVAPPPDEDEE